MFHTLHIVLVWRRLVELLPGPREVHLMGYIWDHFRVFHVALVNQNVVGGIDTGYDVLQMLFAGRHGVPWFVPIERYSTSSLKCHSLVARCDFRLTLFLLCYCQMYLNECKKDTYFHDQLNFFHYRNSYPGICRLLSFVWTLSYDLSEMDVDWVNCQWRLPFPCWVPFQQFQWP